jgi:uncharacterized protein
MGEKMNKLKAFDIEISNIKEHVHHLYNYTLDTSFFTSFEESLIQKGLIVVEVDLEKTPLLIRMNIRLNGSVDLICDRSLDEFEYLIESEKQLIFKFTEEEEGEITEEIIGIKRETVKINIAQYLYEYVNLEVPIKKLHPRFQDSDKQNEQDSFLIYSTEKEEDVKDDTPTEDLIDPRWLALKTLKDKSKLN